MKTIHFTTGLAALALLASGALQAAVEVDSFQILDADANGYISAEESASNQALTTQWTALDKDSNNQLDKAEFSAFEVDTGSAPASGNMMQDGMMQQGTTPSTPAE